MTPDVLTGDVGLPKINMLVHVDAPMKMWRYERLLDARFNTRALALLFCTWHRLFIFFELFPTRNPRDDPIGRHVAP